jgi:hypothetical protein
MKVAENGELFKFLLHTPKFDEPFARHFFSQLLEGKKKHFFEILKRRFPTIRRKGSSHFCDKTHALSRLFDVLILFKESIKQFHLFRIY